MPTRYKGTPDQIVALDTFIKLARSLNAVQGQVIPLLQKEFGITESQFGVLEALHHLGPLCLGQLGEKILRSGSNITTVVDNLERDKLVNRVRDDVDRRVQMVHITQRGDALVQACLPVHVARITKRISVLSLDEQRELGRLCRKLGTAE